MADQMTFKIESAAMPQTNPDGSEPRLRAARVPASFTAVKPYGRSHTRQLTLDYSLEAAELLQSDPLDHQMPRAGDRIEILWAKAWPKQGWSTGRGTDVGQHIISAKMDFNGLTGPAG